MNREQAKTLLPVIQAYAEGKDVQLLNGPGEWETATEPSFWPLIEWRVKPDPVFVKYRRYISRARLPGCPVQYHVAVFHQSSGDPVIFGRNYPGFVKWIDNDWIEQEVPE